MGASGIGTADGDEFDDTASFISWCALWWRTGTDHDRRAVKQRRHSDDGIVGHRRAAGDEVPDRNSQQRRERTAQGRGGMATRPGDLDIDRGGAAIDPVQCESQTHDGHGRWRERYRLRVIHRRARAARAS